MEPTFDETEIRSAERALEEALESPDQTAWVSHYTEDALFVGPGSPAVQGREALLEMARTMIPLSSVTIDAERTEGSGDVACAYGNASWVNGGPPQTGAATNVRFVIVWRREGDGVWRVALEMLAAAPA